MASLPHVALAAMLASAAPDGCSASPASQAAQALHDAVAARAASPTATEATATPAPAPAAATPAAAPAPATSAAKPAEPVAKPKKPKPGNRWPAYGRALTEHQMFAFDTKSISENTPTGEIRRTSSSGYGPHYTALRCVAEPSCDAMPGEPQWQPYGWWSPD